MLARLRLAALWITVLPLLFAMAGVTAAAAATETGKTRSPFAGDARLEKRITLEFAKTPLAEALAEVTRQTGVKLVALERAADEPVALFVKEQPAAEVLRQIAELFGYWWSRRGTAPEPRYELFQDLRSKQEEEAILNGARRAVLATLQAELRRHRQYAALPPDELKKRVEAGDAQLARMMGQGGGGGISGGGGQVSEQMHEWQAARNASQPLGRILLGVLERLTPAQWQTLLAEEPITYSTDPKPGELRLPAEMVTALRSTKPISPLPAAIAKSLGANIQEQFQKLEEKAQEEWSRATGFRLDIQLTLSIASQPVGILRVGPQPLGATPGLAALNGLNIMAMPDLKPQAKPEDPEARKARLARDSVLARKGHQPPAGKPAAETPSFLPFLRRTGEVFRKLAGSYDVNIVADAYTMGSISMGGASPGAPAAPGTAVEEEPLYAALDRAFGLQRDWVRDGEFIRLRSRNWAFDRNMEIPSRLMRQWAAAWKTRDGWDLDQLAAIVDTLRPEQVQTFELAAQEYEIPSGGQLFMLLLSADALRFYAHLLPAQRQTLMAGRPLVLGSLTPAQRPYALSLARGRGRSIVSMFMGPPPWRSLEAVMRSTLTLQGRPAAAMPFGGAAPGASQTPATGAPAKPPAGAPPAPRPPAPRMMAIFQLRFPEGPPDTYVVPGVLPPGTPLPKPKPEGEGDAAR